jgi:hypothetical protein
MVGGREQEMTEIRFNALLSEDRTIREPEGVAVVPGPVEVTLRSQPNGQLERLPGESLAKYLARLAEQAGDLGLPSDLAENHDHYLHGLPKGIDKQ